MAIEYRLTVAGANPAEALAARAVPDATMRPTPSGRLLEADLRDSLGLTLTVRSDTAGYVEAQDDNGDWWTWEPSEYTALTMQIPDDDKHITAVTNMLTIVARILASGAEDLALVVQADTLLLTRQDGIVRKHARTTWWRRHAPADDIIS